MEAECGYGDEDEDEDAYRDEDKGQDRSGDKQTLPNHRLLPMTIPLCVADVEREDGKTLFMETHWYSRIETLTTLSFTHVQTRPRYSSTHLTSSDSSWYTT